MSEKKDYTKLTLEELKLDESKAKKWLIVVIALMILAFWLAAYVVAKQKANFIITIFPLVCAYFFAKVGNQINAIQKAIKDRNSN